MEYKCGNGVTLRHPNNPTDRPNVYTNNQTKSKMTKLWCDDLEETLPEIPWLKQKEPEPWGTLDKRFFNFNCFMDPLDRAGQFYFDNLWNEYVHKAIEKDKLEKELKCLDNATEIYLASYWDEKVKEANDNSEWTTIKRKSR